MNYFLNIAGVLILVAGLAAGFVGQFGVMVFAFFAFVGCLIAANLDRISEFRASARGVEAKTREVIAKAENTLAELQLLARTVAELTLSLVKRSGRMGGYSDQEEEKIKTQVLDVLRNLKTPDRDLPRIMEEWHRFTEFDYAMAILEENNRATFLSRAGGRGTHDRAGKKETPDREMDSLVDFDGADLGLSRCHVGCRGVRRIKVLPKYAARQFLRRGRDDALVDC